MLKSQGLLNSKGWLCYAATLMDHQFETPEKSLAHGSRALNPHCEKPVTLCKSSELSDRVLDVSTGKKTEQTAKSHVTKKQKTLVSLASKPIKSKFVQPKVFSTKGSPFKAVLSRREIIHGWW